MTLSSLSQREQKQKRTKRKSLLANGQMSREEGNRDEEKEGFES